MDGGGYICTRLKIKINILFIVPNNYVNNGGREKKLCLQQHTKYSSDIINMLFIQLSSPTLQCTDMVNRVSNIHIYDISHLNYNLQILWWLLMEMTFFYAQPGKCKIEQLYF